MQGILLLSVAVRSCFGILSLTKLPSLKCSRGMLAAVFLNHPSAYFDSMLSYTAFRYGKLFLRYYLHSTTLWLRTSFFFLSGTLSYYYYADGLTGDQTFSLSYCHQHSFDISYKVARSESTRIAFKLRVLVNLYPKLVMLHLNFGKAVLFQS